MLQTEAAPADFLKVHLIIIIIILGHLFVVGWAAAKRPMTTYILDPNKLGRVALIYMNAILNKHGRTFCFFELLNFETYGFPKKWDN